MTIEKAHLKATGLSIEEGVKKAIGQNWQEMKKDVIAMKIIYQILLMNGSTTSFALLNY